METTEPVALKRNVEASVVPVGTKVTLQAGEPAYITQSLGGTYTVVVNGNMFRIEGRDADALGLGSAEKPAISAAAALGGPISAEQLEKEVWNQMRNCYDPEIPVNIVDLGLIYDCKIEPIAGASNSCRVNVKMTLTAPGLRHGSRPPTGRPKPPALHRGRGRCQRRARLGAAMEPGHAHRGRQVAAWAALKQVNRG